MSTIHRFIDEWFVGQASRIQGVTTQTIEKARDARSSSIVKFLIDAKILTTAGLESVLRKQYHLEMAPKTLPNLDRSSLAIIPQKFCQKYQLVPLSVTEDTITAAMSNPLDINGISDLGMISNRTVVVQYAFPDQIKKWLDVLFNPDAVVDSLLQKLPEDKTGIEVIGDREAVGPVAKLIHQLLGRAVSQGASDIHLEHAELYSSVRFRVDGLLRNVLTLPKELACGPLVSRIKVMANLDLANHFRPQDGGAKIRAGNHDIALRVSILPTHYGEKVVIRLLDNRAAEVTFESLGLPSETSRKLESYLEREQGIILVTGPTGVGKTTTLYAMLNRLRSEGLNLVTVEDPIEYKLEGINQVQINDKQGLTFAGVIRSVMRQDPDIILVGEIRDLETAEVAVQAAMTGHLVLSTLHTNDTISTVSRLADLGLEGYKIGSSVTAILSQRLVRRLCTECKRPVALESIEEPFRASIAALAPATLFVSGGCPKCYFSGFKGRLPLIELLQLDDELCRGISKSVGEFELREMALRKHLLIPLYEDALWHVANGNTSLQEVMPHLRIPILPIGTMASQQKVEAPIELPLDQPAIHSKRVLVVEDDNVTRLLLRTTLQNAGYQVEEAPNGRIGLEKVATLRPDALVLDLQMPEIDGYEVLRGVRGVLGIMDLPILVLTVHSDEETKKKALSLGADDYLSKPINAISFLSRVEALFQRQTFQFSKAA